MRQILTRLTGPSSRRGSPAPPAGGPAPGGTAARPDDGDAALVAALRTGSPHAARRLYDTYGPAVQAFVARRTGDPELAQEITQDVMVRVWQAVPRFDPDLGTFRSWVFRIARNAVIDEGRRAGRRPTVVSGLEWNDREDADVSAAALAEQGGDDIEAFLRSWLIRTALDRLPAEHRAVVGLVYLQQNTVAETARRLGIPEGTVKSRCFYAMANLRTAFQELGVVPHDL